MCLVIAIATARRMLVNDNILKNEDEIEGHGYLLLKTFNEKEKQKLRDNNFNITGNEPDAGDQNKTKRAATEALKSNSVYIIIDPNYIGICKIGSGNGENECNQRLVEAQRWTYYEAIRVHFERVGYGKGRQIEISVQDELGKRFGRKGEWIKCHHDIALEELRAWKERHLNKR